jgi:integrase
MARPPLALGAHGRVTVTESGPGRLTARCRVRDPDGVTRRVEATGASRTAAEQALQVALRSRVAARPGELRGQSRFSDAAELWMVKVAARRSGSTRDAYRRRLDAVVLPALGELRLRECTVGRLDAFMTTLERRGLAANYRSGLRGVVREVLATAVAHEALPANPVDHLERIEGERTPPRAFSPAERARLLAWLDGTSDDKAQRGLQEAARRRGVPDLVRFLLGTGARIGEACAVRWRDVDLEGVPVVAGDQLRAVPVVSLGPVITRVKGEGLVRVERGKTASAARTVPLPEFAAAMLRARPDGAPGDEPVFAVAGRTGPSWLDPAQAGKYLSAAFDGAGLGWATSHVCRKTYLTILDDERALSDRVKADLMGHATLLRDTYVGRGGFHPEAAAFVDAAYRD